MSGLTCPEFELKIFQSGLQLKTGASFAVDVNYVKQRSLFKDAEIFEYARQKHFWRPLHSYEKQMIANEI